MHRGGVDTDSLLQALVLHYQMGERAMTNNESSRHQTFEVEQRIAHLE